MSFALPHDRSRKTSRGGSFTFLDSPRDTIISERSSSVSNPANHSVISGSSSRSDSGSGILHRRDDGKSGNRQGIQWINSIDANDVRNWIIVTL